MIYYRSGYKYQLEQEYQIKLPAEFSSIVTARKFLHMFNGVLTIREGYAWDGPSGPTFDTKTFMRGSLVHDALYQLMREKVMPMAMKKEADDILRDICIEDGMSKIRAWYVHRAVKKFGLSAITKNKDIEVAP